MSSWMKGGVLALLALGATGSFAASRKAIQEEVDGTYPAVLAAWSAGDDESALATLAEMEIGLLGPDYEPREIEALWKAKLSVVRRLMGSAGVNVLAPIMMLHHDAYLEYRRQDLPVLARHSRVMAEELADVYARQREDRPGRELAGSILTSLGGYLQHGYSFHASAALFGRALDIDAGADVAYLGLGALYERRAELEEAVEQFRKAVTIRPDSFEARLRMAVCLKRLGRPAEAESEFRALLESEAPGWVETIAFEELGDLLGRAGRDPEPVLRRGIEKFPANSRLKIELSHWLERRGAQAESYGLVEEALLRLEPERESARYVYSRWPLDRLEALRGGLRLTIDEYAPLLASGVQGLASDERGAS